MNRFDEKYKLIEKTALEVFYDQGFEKLTLENVAEKLGYKKQALYYYFPNKEKLIQTLCLNILRSERNEFIRISSTEDNPEIVLKNIIVHFVEESSRKKGFFTLQNDLKMIMNQIHNHNIKEEILQIMSEISSGIIEVVKKGIELKIFRNEDPKAQGGIVLALLAGIVAVPNFMYLSDLSVGRKSELIINFVIEAIKA